MMDSQLKKSSIKERLLQYGVEDATGRIRSTALREEMSLIGFVPFDFTFYGEIIARKFNLNNKLFVSPYHISVGNGPVYPYFKKAKLAEGIKYKLDEFLIIDKFAEDIKNDKKSFPFTADQLFGYKGSFPSSLKKNLGLFEFDETSHLAINYIGQKDDIELYTEKWRDRSISNDLLCLCTYMNNVTGMPSYILLPAYDTIRVIPEKEVGT